MTPSPNAPGSTSMSYMHHLLDNEEMNGKVQPATAQKVGKLIDRINAARGVTKAQILDIRDQGTAQIANETGELLYNVREEYSRQVRELG